MSQPVPGARLRADAARALCEVLFEGRSLRAVVAARLPAIVDPRDRALFEAMLFAALRWQRRYAHVAAGWMSRPLPARDRPVQALLWLGLAQLDELAMPPHAALSATAEAARVLGRPQLVGLVNALLRRALREPWPESGDPAIRQSYPDWLAARLRADWPAHWPGLLEAGNRPGPMWLRANRRRLALDAARAALEDAGFGVAETVAPAALRLAQSTAPQRLPGWETGDFAVQDLAAQQAVAALGAHAGERVLDACAAPGGKSAWLLENVPGIRLTALDADAARVERLRAEFDRLGHGGALALRVADAAVPADWWDGEPFDAVLLDAPCSATGVIRRQPDIKWHRRPEDIDALLAAQARLLDALWPLLRPGGRLLYATCSLLRAENAGQVEAFLARTPDACTLDLPADLGEADGPGRQRFPAIEGGDGFFCALLGKHAG